MENQQKDDAEVSSVGISAARSKEDLAEIARMFVAYADFLPVDLAFQGFETELATLPGSYKAPQGELFLARDEHGSTLGCVGLRPIEFPGVCEMKRLFVEPFGRGRSVGMKLAVRVIDHARELGYAEMKLDTLGSLTSALKLYRKLGFVEIPPYYFNPNPGVVFLSLRL